MKKVLSIFIIFGFAMSSFAIVTTIEEADKAATQVIGHVTQADKNIQEAKSLLEKGEIDQAKEAVKKAIDFSAQSKKYAQKVAETTHEVKKGLKI